MRGQGGAVLEVRLSRKGDGISEKRYYREPGMSADSRGYDELCLEEGRVYGSSVLAFFVEGGILWLEKDSESQFSLSSYWFFLKRKESDL